MTMDGRKSRKGFIAVTALLIMAILLMIGVAFLSMATTENTMVVNEINGQVAFNIAEAGIDHAKRALLGANLNNVLADNSSVGFGTSNRKTIPFPDGTNGNYVVTVTNNNCTPSGCMVMGKPGDAAGTATTDTDSQVVVESSGTYRTATKVIRALIWVPAAILNPPSSIYTLNGPTAADPTDFNFNGNSFLVQGRDTAPGQTTPISGGAAVPGEGVMACSTCNPGHTPLQEANSALNGQQTNNITGAGTNPSIAVVTSSITASSLTTLKPFLTAHASLTCTGSTSFSNNTPPSNCTGSSSLGTQTNPQITVVNGALDLQGPVNGFGILLVTGHFRMRGNATFQGIILVDGDDGMVEFEGNGNTVWGSIIQINRSSSNSGETRLSIGGNAQIYYSRQAIQDYGGGSLSATTLAWSERT